jgi:hypothetical protein
VILKLRNPITIGLLSIALVGCAEARREAALQAWRSPNSTPEQRAHAVSKLVQKGASRQSVENVLGTNGVWSRFHGPSIDITHATPRQLPPVDFWFLDYRFADGGVVLFFDPPTSFGDRFVRVNAYQTLGTFPLINAP